MTTQHNPALSIPPNNQRPQVEPEAIDASEPEQEINGRASIAPSEGRTTHTRQPLHSSGSRSLSATYNNLPNGILQSNFKDIFMLTIAKYVVKLADQDPWNTTTKDYTNVIQHVWNAVFPDVPYKFLLNGAHCDVFRLVSSY